MPSVDGSERARTYVLDTSALYLKPQACELPELSERPAVFAIPHTTLSELDLLAQRPVTRAKARAALNVLQQLVDRGAATKSVSWGKRASVCLLSADQEKCSEPSLRLEFADDRILAAGLTLSHKGEWVVIVTTEFAMHARALTLGLESVYLGNLASSVAVASANARRQIEQLETAWNRLVASGGAWQALWRAVRYVRLPAAQSALDAIRADPNLLHLKADLEAMERFGAAWTPGINWRSILKASLGIDPPAPPDMGSKRIWEAQSNRWNVPSVPGYGSGQWRTESAGEREARLRLEERAFRDQEEFIIDSVVYRVEGLHHWIVGQLEVES